MLKKEKAEHFHSADKIIVGTLRWKPVTGGRYRIEATVLSPADNEVLKLNCTFGRTNHAFCLLYQNHPIRKYTKHFRHRSRSTGEEFDRPHKHTWSEDCEDDRAYIPQDIDPQSDINEQLLAFLKEENIVLKNGYQRILF